MLFTNLLSSVMDLAEQMIINGAEIYRVEDSINRIFSAFNAKKTDAFIVSPSIVVSVKDSDGNVYTQTRRVNGSVINLEKLHNLNSLSRRICVEKLSYEQINAELDLIKKSKSYSIPVQLFSSALIAGCFTLFFGGTAIEAIVSFLIGIVIKTSTYFMRKIEINVLFSKFVISFFLTILSFMTFKLGIVDSIAEIIIGNIMYLIPGIGFTNSIRDLFKGDIFTGVHRLVESVLLSLALAAGYLVAILITGGAAI